MEGSSLRISGFLKNNFISLPRSQILSRNQCSDLEAYPQGLRIKSAPVMPMKATTADRMKAGVNEPVRSAIFPATGGARAWPVLKMKMMNPRAAGARRGPTMSPTAAAMIEGTDQAVRPKRMVEAR
jgi:hypothetical protein